MSDATILFREMAADAAGKSANKIAPSEEQRRNMDRPADDNTWHDTPDRNELKQQFKKTVNKNAPAHRQDFHDAAGNATQEAHPSGAHDPQDATRLAAQDQGRGTGQSGVDATGGAKQGIDTLRNRADQNVDPKTKDHARDVKETSKLKTKNFLNSHMPQERREQTIWRLKKMVVEIQGHQDYNQAITTLLDLAENYAGHSRNLANEASDSVQGVRESDSNLKKAERDLKTLIERFANYTSLDDFFASIDELYRDADRDPELKDWFKKANRYVRKCLQEQGYILEDRATDEWNDIYDHGQFLLRDRYRNHTDRVVDELKFLNDQFNQDELNRKFGDSCQKMFNDLGNDEHGKPTFKPHLLKDISEVILPAIFENTRYVPIPRIEYQDQMMDCVIENLIIESDNLMPNAVEFTTDNYMRWGRKSISNKKQYSGGIAVSGVQCDLRDVSYYIKKKQGFPSITDIGVADILLYGSGLNFKIKMSSATKKDRQNFFKVDKVDVDVKNFNIKLKQSNHKMLFGIFKPLLLKVVRPALQKAFEKVIREKFEELDRMAYGIKQEADKAQEQVKDDPTQAKNIYSRYASAAQKKFTEKKRKTEEVAADKKVNVAPTQKESLFPSIKLPGGISSKATEYKELAQKGNKWESPIFSIGSASKTSSLPKPQEISRKQHRVTEGGLRGEHHGSDRNRQRDQYGNQYDGQYDQRQGGHANTGDLQQGGSYGNNVTGQPDFQNGQTTGAYGSQGDVYDKTQSQGTMLGQQNPVYNGQAGVGAQQTQRY